MTPRARPHPFRAALTALVLAAPAAAQDTPAGSEHDPDAGADLYQAFCATCHGQNARGVGPTAEILAVAPTNLRRLAAENGGTFPTGRVVRRIDGRDEVLAHGTPMPVFGPFFDGDDTALRTPAGQPVLTSRPIADLVAWLRTVQEGE